MRYINIIKEQIPYKFDCQIEKETFTFIILYNSELDYFTIDLYKDDEPLIFGDKIVYGKPLFSTYDHINKPKINIIPLDIGKKEKTVNYKNLGESVFLYLDEEGALDGIL